MGLKATQVRHYVRRDLLTPLRGLRGEFRFSFQDVVMLRSAKELLDADVPVRRANRVLLDLKARNAEASRPLSSLRVQAEGTRVVVQEGNTAWDAESGQGTLPFMFDTDGGQADAPAGGKLATLSILGSGVGADGNNSASGLGDRSADYFDDAAPFGLDKATQAQRDAALGLLDALRARDSRDNSREKARLPWSEDAQDASNAPEATGTPGAGAERPATSDTYEQSDQAGVEAVISGSANSDSATSDSKRHEAHSPEDAPTSDDELIRVPEVSQLSSDDWYNLALDLEEADPEKAPAAYRQALTLNPKNTDAQVNLGRLCQLRGNLKQARRHYKVALEGAPEHQLANYNMGTIYDELDEFDTAREYYARAKDIPDAHYNLARLFEVRGDELAALRHMREYRRLLEADISGR